RDRAQYNSDLEQRLGILEIRDLRLGVVALFLPLLSLRHQLLLAFAARGVAFVARRGVAIALDQLARLAALIARQRAGTGLQFELGRSNLVKSLAYVFGLVEGVGVGGL